MFIDPGGVGPRVRPFSNRCEISGPELFTGAGAQQALTKAYHGLRFRRVVWEIDTCIIVLIDECGMLNAEC